jgi:hypothetical protein
MGRHTMLVKGPAYELQVAKISKDEATILRKTSVDALRDSIEDDLDMRLADGQIFSGHLLYPNMRPLSLFIDEELHLISEQQIKTDHFCKVHPVLPALNPTDSDFFLVRRAILASSRFSLQMNKKLKLSDLCFEIYRYQLLDSTFLNLAYSVWDESLEFDTDSGGDEFFSLVTFGAKGKYSEVRVSS